MAFAQRNYTQILGSPGNESIADAGCFLTSFANLELDYGVNIDPPTLNQDFISRGIFLADGSLKDNLTWSSITQYDSQTHASQIVDHGTAQTAGWPGSNQAIVRFHYRSIAHPTLPNGQANMIWHFCKVADVNNHTILDSWDGVVKQSPYGEPTAWATYSRFAPTPVRVNPNPAPVVQAPAPPPPPAPETYTVVKSILGYGDSNNAANHLTSVDTVMAGTYFVFNKAHNMINVTKVAGKPGAWINPDDNVAYSSATIQGAAQTSKPTYTLKNTVLGYKNANDAVNDKNAQGSVSPGEYNVYNTRYGMLNLTKTDKPGSWINPKDDVAPVVSDWHQATVAPAKPAPAVAPATAQNPTQWKSTYKLLRNDYKGVKFTMLADYGAHDLNDYDPVTKQYGGEVFHLPKGLSIAFYGTFTGPDGNKYWRPKLKNDHSFTKMVGVPYSDLVNGIPEIIIEEQQQQLDSVALSTYKSAGSSLSSDFSYAVAIAEKLDKGLGKAIKVIDGYLPKKKG